MPDPVPATQPPQILGELRYSHLNVVVDPNDQRYCFLTKAGASGNFVPEVPALMRGELFALAIILSESLWLEQGRPDLALKMFDPRIKGGDEVKLRRRLERIDSMRKARKWVSIPRERRNLFQLNVPLYRFGLCFTRENTTLIKILRGDDPEGKVAPRFDVHVAGNLANLILRDEGFADYLRDSPVVSECYPNATRESALSFAPTDAPTFWIGGRLDPDYVKSKSWKYEQGNEPAFFFPAQTESDRPRMSSADLWFAQWREIEVFARTLGSKPPEELGSDKDFQLRLRAAVNGLEGFGKKISTLKPDLQSIEDVIRDAKAEVLQAGQQVRDEILREIVRREQALLAGEKALAESGVIAGDRTKLDSARAAFDAERKQFDALRQQLEAERQQFEAARQKIAAERQELDLLRRQLETAQAALEAAKEKLEAEREEFELDRATAPPVARSEESSPVKAPEPAPEAEAASPPVEETQASAPPETSIDAKLAELRARFKRTMGGRGPEADASGSTSRAPAAVH